MIDDPSSLQINNVIHVPTDQGYDSFIIDASYSSVGIERHYFVATDDYEYYVYLVNAGTYSSFTYLTACGYANDYFNAQNFNLLIDKYGVNLDIVNSLLADYEETKDKTKLGLLN